MQSIFAVMAGNGAVPTFSKADLCSLSQRQAVLSAEINGHCCCCILGLHFVESLQKKGLYFHMLPGQETVLS